MVQPNRQSSAEGDPSQYVASIKRRLNEIVENLREEVDGVSDPKAQALFETTAEVLRGLLTAYDHYEKRSERAWR
jgi:hypothetical protein